MKNILQKISTIFILTTTIFILGVSNLYAQNNYTQNGFISEFRAGVLFHSVDRPGPNGEALNLTRFEDISFEVLFASPDVDVFRWIGSPRPNFGATINLNGRESKIHLALTWQMQIFESNFFIEGSLGAALHDGAISGVSEPARNLGSRILFYEALGLGMNITNNMNIILFAEHASNANLVQPNNGLSNIGVKLGYKF